MDTVENNDSCELTLPLAVRGMLESWTRSASRVKLHKRETDVLVQLLKALGNQSLEVVSVVSSVHSYRWKKIACTGSWSLSLSRVMALLGHIKK